jgi:hypothetical protein
MCPCWIPSIEKPEKCQIESRNRMAFLGQIRHTCRRRKEIQDHITPKKVQFDWEQSKNHKITLSL